MRLNPRISIASPESSSLGFPLFFVDRATRPQALSQSFTGQQTRGLVKDKRMIVLRCAMTHLSPQIFIGIEMVSTRCLKNEKMYLFPSELFSNLLRSLSASRCVIPG
jgi:hypothetical protein